jgi:cholesterol oxidase
MRRRLQLRLEEHPRLHLPLDGGGQGATIRPLHEVKGFARDASGGWRVRYVDHSDGCHARPGELRCDRLVLSAGALGTTFLLLRNRAATPEVSPMLGRRFSGNGDYLTFAARSTAPVDPSHGPVITSALAVPDAANGGDGPGFYLEDGGYPAFLAWYWEAAMLPSGLVRLLGRRKTRRLAGYLVRGLLAARFPRVPGNPERNFSGELAALLGSLDPSWVPILGMGRDRADGVLSLGKDGKLDLRRSWAANAPYYHRVEDCSRQLARAMGGTFEPSLLRWFNLAITVHPLGGCPMGVSKTEGVVNPRNGEVWGSPGLHVADGSVLPGPAGANPSLTIAAVAHHFADGILRDG